MTNKLLEGLEHVVEVAPEFTSGMFEPIAAFNVRAVAEDYAKDCAKYNARNRYRVCSFIDDETALDQVRENLKLATNAKDRKEACERSKEILNRARQPLTTAKYFEGIG